MIATLSPQSTPTLFDSLVTEASRQLVGDIQAVGPVRDTGPWREWLPRTFPDYITGDFGTHHAELWDWVWSLERGTSPHPFVGIWPRGGAKSTSAEMATVAVGRRRVRNFVLYVSGTQDQANEHVQSIASMLESAEIERDDPALADRDVNKYGQSRGWRHDRLTTSSGLVVAAIGLDVNVRGLKVRQFRPDLIVIDDVDNETDTPQTTAKKIARLTKAILPAGSDDVAVLAIQNLVIPDGVFAQLARKPGTEGAANFLTNRYVSGPIPALYDMDYEQRDGRFVITAGTPSWTGQDIERCQAMVDEFGISAFLEECQHEVDAPAGGMFSHLEYRHITYDDLPTMERVVVWVDPAVSATDKSDSHGIQADGLGEDGLLYRLWSWEQVTTPRDSLRRAILKAVELGATTVGVETDQGGDTWRDVYDGVISDLRHEGAFLVNIDELDQLRLWLEQRGKDLAPIDRVEKPDEYPIPAFRGEKAGAGHGSKVHRAAQMLADYERGRIIHVEGTHRTLERALRRFPAAKPFDLVDAAYWSWHDLMRVGGVTHSKNIWE